MINQTNDLSRIERRLRQMLELYGRARTRGDFLEAILSVHNALEEALNAHLGEQSQEQSFSQKVAIVLPQFHERFNVADLNRQRNFYAHPKQHFTDSQIRNTAVGFVNLVLAAWTDLFGHYTHPPAVAHPPLPPVLIEPNPAEAPQSVPVASSTLPLEPSSDQRPVVKTKIAWRALLSGLLLLWPLPWLAGFVQYLWREMPIAWYWPLLLSALILTLAFLSVRNLWRFLCVIKFARLITALAVGLLAATLTLTPSMNQEVGWAGRAGAALTRVLNFTRFVTLGAATTSFASGIAHASTLFSSAPTRDIPEPISTKITPLPTLTIPETKTPAIRNPAVTPSPEIGIGAQVIVTTDGRGLLSRARPGKSAEVVARFENGAELLILDGPQQVEGSTWWKVKGQNGSGWSTAQFLTPISADTNRKVKE